MNTRTFELTRSQAYGSSGAPTNPWLVVHRPVRQPLARIFCFAYAGGSANIFREWPERLPNRIELVAIELPGRQRRFGEPLLHRLGDLLNHLERQIEPLSDVPFALFGHSFGALVAFELARGLRRQGKPLPFHLFLSGCPAPGHKNRTEALHLLGDEDFIDRVAQMGGIPQEVLRHRELVQLYLPILRADIEMVETWNSPKEDPLDIAITALGGADDGEVSRSALEAWVNRTIGLFDRRVMPGGHFFLTTAREQILDIISDGLTRGLADHPTPRHLAQELTTNARPSRPSISPLL